jgi:hypothetical protein
MEKVSNKNDRSVLLQKLRTAVCLQISVWDQCNKVSEILDDDTYGDAVSLVEQVAREHAGKDLQLSNLGAVLGRFWVANPNAAVKNASEEMRHALLAGFQSAVRLQSKLLGGATSLATALGCTRESALESIRGFATCAESGMELSKRDLQILLGEPEAKDYIRVGGPLES